MFTRVILLFKRIKKNDFFQNGVPLILTVVGGSLFLTYIGQIRRDYGSSHNKTISLDELEQLGISVVRRQINLEEEYEKIKKYNETHDWKNIRAPRFWEDNEEFLKAKEEQQKRFQEERELETKKNEEFKEKIKREQDKMLAERKSDLEAIKVLSK